MDRRDPEFEEWLFEKSVKEIVVECMGVLDILYDEYYEGWDKERGADANQLHLEGKIERSKNNV